MNNEKRKFKKSLYEYCVENNKLDLLSQYSPNNKFKADEISCSSEEIVKWFMPYDDLEMEKHFDFIWKATVASRVYNNLGCPFLSNQQVWRGYNDLETYCKKKKEKEYLLKEWDYDRNEKQPWEYTSGSGVLVNWVIKYKMKKGNIVYLRWKTDIHSRAKEGCGCPYLTKGVLLKGFNDLETWCNDNDRNDILEDYNRANNEFKAWG